MQHDDRASSGYWYGSTQPAAAPASSTPAPLAPVDTSTRPDAAEPGRPRPEHAEPAVRVLNALRDYRTAESAMRRRSREAMGMGEKDMLALRYLLEANRAGTPLTPGDLARRLSISTASTTTLLDRLTRSGHVRRAPHPTDRRALVVLPTADTDGEVRSTLGSMHERMLGVARSLDPAQAEIVTDFLTAMADQVAAPLDPPHPAGHDQHDHAAPRASRRG
ncbi:MarR family winged helix-turn-helix transcriptional regulator [Tersicoccus sp. Bi-70]|uniref:MarR family winged helix-turn-helix transcriptional regulator n=1 Tax=Tersicoccus sp. Bi-70 TaxID=1897634 RepID=UPI0009F92C0E|nr:MarR family transcriptional regulator [Tersicoccus sp. Bi-70]